MNFKLFTEKFFEGNIENSLRHLVNESYYQNYSLTGSADNLQKILNEFDRETTKKFMTYFKETVKKDKIKMQEDFKVMLDSIGPKTNSSYEEVKNAQVNPYKSTVRKSLLKTLIGGSGLIAFTFIAQSMGEPELINSLLPGLVTLLSANIAFDLGINLVNYFKFKKEKQKLEKSEKTEFYDKQNGGRKL